MPYVQVPKDLSKVKTKLAFNLTKRQLICFSGAAAVGIPVYLLTRPVIGSSPALFLMIGLMLPFFRPPIWTKKKSTLRKKETSRTGTATSRRGTRTSRRKETNRGRRTKNEFYRQPL